MSLFSRREFLSRVESAATAGVLGLAAARAAAQVPGDRPRQAPEVAVLNPRHAGPGRADHRRLDLSREPQSLRDAAVRRGVRREQQSLRAGLESLAGRDPRQLRAPLRYLVRGARRQGEVLDRAVPGVRRTPRSRPARLEPARARRQPGARADADAPQLGHPPGDGDAHARDRSGDRASLRRPFAEIHGELGVDDRAVGR